NSDITVGCGYTTISVEVDLCTAQWAGFNETQLALNGAHNNPHCLGTVDTSVDPPVLRFQLPVNDSEDNPCRQSLQIVDEETSPDGAFSDFLSIQSVLLTGFIDTPRAQQGLVSYSTNLTYEFSCRYPLQYLLNDTQIVSSVSVAKDERNGTFIDSLKIAIFNDSDYAHPLVIPPTGLKLRTLVYVAVEAINLTGFHVLMDHCFSTPSPFNISNSEKHSFFTCEVNERSNLTSNGESKTAKFHFEAFRFLMGRDQTKSSLFVHCLVRLCEPTKCQELLS
uniref:Si:dkey-103g5.3 n=1 Tax=Cynoglossus semilaevis TaxID=244447 RepID=A0A3P8WGV9_CYNSE